MTQRKIKLSKYLCVVLFMCLAILGIGNIRATESNIAYAATTPKYLLNGTVNYVANLPYNAGYNKTVVYSDMTGLSNYFSVHLYANSYSVEQTAAQNMVFNFSYVTIVANVKQSKSPHNQNYPFAHQSFSLVNNTTGATVASGNLSGTGERTLVAKTIPDGHYTLKYVAGGGRSGLGAGTITDNFSYDFYIDATAPTYSLKAGGAEVASGSYTNSLVTFSASDTRLSRIYYKKPSSSSFSYTTSTSYAVSATTANNGLWTFYAEDTVSNKSREVTIYIDTVAPVGTITAGSTTITSGSYVNKAFSYKATDSGGVQSCEYKTPSSNVWKSYTAGTQIGTSSTNGWYYFRARDCAGQYSTEQSVYLDSGKPTGTLYAGTRSVANGTVTNAGYISFTGSDSQSGIDKVYVKKPGASQYAQVANGSQYVVGGTYLFYCTDKAGTASDIYEITLDRTAPEIVCKETGFGTLTNKSFTVTATDDSGQATLYYRYESEQWKTADGNSHTVQGGAREGKYSFYAEDDNNNQTAVVWIVYSTATPEGRIVKSDKDNSVYFTWANDYWTATLDGKPYNKGVWITKEGEHTIVVSNSIGMKSAYTFSIDHNFIEKEKVLPTCTEQGYTIVECSGCGDTQQIEYVKANGHDYVETATPATCTESAKRLFTCQTCGYDYTITDEPAAGHRFESTLLSKSTCTETGVRLHVCSVCEYRYTSEIPAFGHQYEITDVDAGDGKTVRTYTCAVCGDTYTQDLGNQYEKVTNYVEYLFNLYSPYMVWVFLATAGVWSIVLGVMIIIAHKNEDKEKAKKMLVNYGIGLIVIFCILIACPYLIKGIAALIV